MIKITKMFEGGRTEHKELEQIPETLEEYGLVLERMKLNTCHSMVVTFEEGQVLFTLSETK